MVHCYLYDAASIHDHLHSKTLCISQHMTFLAICNPRYNPVRQVQAQPEYKNSEFSVYFPNVSRFRPGFQEQESETRGSPSEWYLSETLLSCFSGSTHNMFRHLAFISVCYHKTETGSLFALFNLSFGTFNTDLEGCLFGALWTFPY